jgi:hypothetical protein
MEWSSLFLFERSERLWWRRKVEVRKDDIYTRSSDVSHVTYTAIAQLGPGDINTLRLPSMSSPRYFESCRIQQMSWARLSNQAIKTFKQYHHIPHRKQDSCMNVRRHFKHSLKGFVQCLDQSHEASIIVSALAADSSVASVAFCIQRKEQHDV